MSDAFTTTSRSMFAADTGLGKTMCAVALAVAMRLDRDFLNWKAHRPARVLLVDGEMPRELLKERIVGAFDQASAQPVADGLWFLSREDYEDMPPLDTDEGHEWLLAFIADLGGVDFVIFDNLMSLCCGDLRDEMTWKALKPLVLELTKRRVGQFWIQHVGHDKSRPYGSKTFQWHFDNVILGETVDEATAAGADLAFKLTFQKARRRTPDNRTDFATAIVRLSDGERTAQPEDGQAGRRGGVRLPKGAQTVLSALCMALAQAGEGPPPHAMTAGVSSAVRLRTWRAYYKQMAGYEQDEKGLNAERKAFNRGKDDLLAARRAVVWGDWAWTV